ncbi:unnamed protein product [Rotaria sp. Silwood1]|nr:unnamed protein product [Rotaria sp. Silwood1]CAF4975014.1 unnamed protein product [Rotaria sp. Silwood1]
MPILNSLLDKHQHELRSEFERRQKMLEIDAQDHQLVEQFYQIKLRKTEIQLAKLLWKATQDEQQLRYEIVKFQQWLSKDAADTCQCTFQDWQLSAINSILIEQLVDRKWITLGNDITDSHTKIVDTFISDLMQQIIRTAEATANQYVERIKVYNNTILSNKTTFKKPPTVHNLLKAIEARQQNMIHRVQLNMKHLYKQTRP